MVNKLRHTLYSNNGEVNLNGGELRDILEDPIILEIPKEGMISEIIREVNKRLQSLKEEVIGIEKLTIKIQQALINRMVLFYRLQLNLLSLAKDHPAIHMTITDYLKWKGIIVKIGKLGSHFDILKLPEENILKLEELYRDILQTIKTDEALANEEILNVVRSVSEEKTIYTADSHGIWGGQEEEFLIKEKLTKQNVAWLRLECGKKGNPS